RDGGGGIAGAVVDHDHQVHARDPTGGQDGRLDPLRLVLGGDHHGDPLGTVRRQRPRGAHRSVTCRATMPPRARRSSAVSGSVEASASSKRLRNASTSASTPAAPYPLGRSHTGMVRPSARKEPTYLVPSPMADSRRACNRVTASITFSSSASSTQRRCSLEPASTQ